MSRPAPATYSPAFRHAAFTLVEIMIVVVIIGILASLAIPGFQKMRTASQDKAVLNNARQIANAAEQYYHETGSNSVLVSELVGPSKFVKTLDPIAGETYPTTLFAATPVTVLGVAGSRTITYSP
jgi:prepilin-type N-terminal cleavage/methylation domain-containing protein